MKKILGFSIVVTLLLIAILPRAVEGNKASFTDEDFHSKNSYYSECLREEGKFSIKYQDESMLMTINYIPITEVIGVSKLRICSGDSYQEINVKIIGELSERFNLEDINDDGYFDIVQLDWMRSSASNYYNNYWIYDPETVRFELSDLSFVQSPVMDKEKGVLYSYWTYTYLAGGFTAYSMDGLEKTKIRDFYTLYPEEIDGVRYQKLYAVDYVDGKVNAYFCKVTLLDEGNSTSDYLLHNRWRDVSLSFTEKDNVGTQSCIEPFIEN